MHKDTIFLKQYMPEIKLNHGTNTNKLALDFKDLIIVSCDENHPRLD